MLNLLKPLGPSRVLANQSPNRFPKPPPKAQNCLPKPKIGFLELKIRFQGPKFAPKPKIGTPKHKKTQIGSASPKLAPRSPKSAPKPTNWLPKPKIGFRSPKLAPRPQNWLTPQNWLQSPNLAQHWPKKPKICSLKAEMGSSPKLAPQNWLPGSQSRQNPKTKKPKLASGAAEN